MLIWVPRWSVKPPHNRVDESSFFGGVPTGLAAESWPVCGECSVVMTPLLQLAAGPWLPRIPDAHVLLVFKCESDEMCDFWDPDDVANRCLLIPVAELTAGAGAPESVASGETRILPHIWVTEWEQREDGITAEQAEQIDDPELFWQLPDEISAAHGYDSLKLTKAGGAPYWTGQGPSNDPPAPRQLLFQIDNWITLSDSPEDIAAHLSHVDELVTVSRSTVSAANFMSDGIAFVFDVTPAEPLPTLKLMISR